MDVRPSILCPVDFSDASAGALRYAAAIASHFGTRLIVLTVEDPLLTEAADLGTGIRWVDDSPHTDLSAALIEAVSDSTSVVCVSAVQYATGTALDVAAAGHARI